MKRGYVYRRTCSGIRIQEITQKRIGWETWTLYIVSASAFNEEAARFYLGFHCRLTEHPVSLQPVWPLFVEGNYIVKHNQNNMYMLIEGNISTVNTFPSVMVRQLNYNSHQPKLYEVFCSDRQQLISIGRTQALQYTYFWKEPLNQTSLRPKVSVTDIAGTEIVLAKQIFCHEIKRCGSNQYLMERYLSSTITILWINENYLLINVQSWMD